MATDKAFIILQLFAQIVQFTNAVQYFSVLFVKQQIPPRYLAVLQFVQFQPCDSRLTSQDQTVLFILAALPEYRIHQSVEALLPDRLQLIKIGPHFIGIHSVFRRGCQINDLHRSIILTDLSGGTDSILSRHQNIQKYNIQPGPPLYFRQQFQRTVKCCISNILIPFYPISVHQNA